MVIITKDREGAIFLNKESGFCLDVEKSVMSNRWSLVLRFINDNRDYSLCTEDTRENCLKLMNSLIFSIHPLKIIHFFQIYIHYI